jgi:hypothetical protein
MGGKEGGFNAKGIIKGMQRGKRSKERAGSGK